MPSGAAQQRGDDLAGALPARRGEPLELLGVLVLDADDDRQLRVGVAGDRVDIARVDRCEVSVEVARYALGTCRLMKCDGKQLSETTKPPPLAGP